MINVYKIATVCLAVLLALLVTFMITPWHWWVQPANNQPHDIPNIPQEWSAFVYEDGHIMSAYETTNHNCSLVLVKQNTNSPNATTNLTMQCMEEIPMLVDDSKAGRYYSEPSDFTFTTEHLDKCLMRIWHNWWSEYPAEIRLSFDCN